MFFVVRMASIKFCFKSASNLGKNTPILTVDHHHLLDLEVSGELKLNSRSPSRVPAMAKVTKVGHLQLPLQIPHFGGSRPEHFQRSKCHK